MIPGTPRLVLLQVMEQLSYDLKAFITMSSVSPSVAEINEGYLECLLVSSAELLATLVVMLRNFTPVPIDLPEIQAWRAEINDPYQKSIQETVPEATFVLVPPVLEADYNALVEQFLSINERQK